MDEKEDVQLKLGASETHITCMPEKENEKIAAILEACKWKDLKSLRKLATSEGGLLTDELRRKACKFPDLTSITSAES